MTISTRHAGLPLLTIDRADLPPARLRPMMAALSKGRKHRAVGRLLRPVPAFAWVWDLLGELGKVTASLNESLRRRNLRTVHSVFDLIQGDISIIPQPRVLDPSSVGGRPVAHVGHLLRGIETEPEVPESVAGIARGGQRLVYVTLGTYYKDPLLLAEICRAFARRNYRVLMTAPLLPPSERPQADANVTFFDWLPARKTAAIADVVVHHGGHGTMLTTVAAGTPSVTFEAGATGRDVYAKRLARAGASVHLPLKHVSGENLVTAVERVLNDHEYRRRTRALAAMMSALGGPLSAVQIAEASVRARERQVAPGRSKIGD
jgi:UDP:flavonoid glycosyltransferase YjiC (YdhE family)